MKSDQTPGRREAQLGAGVILLGLVGMLALTLIPSDGGVSPLSLCVFCGDYGGTDFVLNVALFVPFGVGLGLRRVSPGRAVALVVLTTVGIELLQMTVVKGRSAALGDLIGNTLGGCAGIFVGRSWRWFLVPGRASARTLAVVWGFVWMAIAIVGAYAARPSFTGTPYFGEWTPGQDDWNRFRGKVLTVSIADRQLDNDDPFGRGMTHPERFKSAMLDGAEVGATITPGPPTLAQVPIVRVVDNLEEELIQFAQGGRDLFFLVRSGARDLRMRQASLALANAMPPDSTSDTLRLRGRLVDNRFVASVSGGRGGVTTSGTLVQRPSLSWSMLVPFFVATTERTARWLEALWSTCLLLPLAYWAGRTREGRWQLLAAGAATAGLFLPALAIGVALPSALEVGLCTLGFVASTFAGRRSGDQWAGAPRPAPDGQVPRTRDIATS